MGHIRRNVIAASLRTGTIVASSLMASAGHAQTTIDITKISCQQFVKHEVDTDNIALWLAGYYAGKRGDTTVDLQLLRRRLQQLKDDCELNQGSLMGAAEKVLSSSE
jgi:hypothetical protein